MYSWTDLKEAVESLCSDVTTMLHKEYATIESKPLNRLLDLGRTLEWLVEVVYIPQRAKIIVLDALWDVLEEVKNNLIETESPNRGPIIDMMNVRVWPILSFLQYGF